VLSISLLVQAIFAGTDINDVQWICSWITLSFFQWVVTPSSRINSITRNAVENVATGSSQYFLSPVPGTTKAQLKFITVSVLGFAFPPCMFIVHHASCYRRNPRKRNIRPNFNRSRLVRLLPQNVCVVVSAVLLVIAVKRCDIIVLFFRNTTTALQDI